MFGVLEHVSVWKNDGEKYRERVPETTEHRRIVLNEVSRVLTENGALYITRFPNTFGWGKYIIRPITGNIGHLNSERARPNYLNNLINDIFEIECFFSDGLLPHHIPLSAPSFLLPLLYAHTGLFLSNLPILRQIAQNYCIIANPR